MSEYIKDNRIIAIDMLIPHPQNYRRHPDEQVHDLILSLQRFGQGRSIVIQDAPGKKLIVAGHGIVEAAKALQWTEIRADLLPADWTPEQVKGYLIADNNVSKKASDDETLLAQLLQEQANAGYDLASLGSDEESLRQMLESLGDSYLGSDEERDEEEDELPEQVETRCKPGDIWQLGRHKIIVGNSFDVEILNILMGDEKTDLLLCDPPYGMNFDPGMSAQETRKGNWVSKPRFYDKVVGDEKDFDPRFLMEYFSGCKEQFWWGADYYADKVPNRNDGAWFVWDKREGIEDVEFSTSAFELCWSKQKHARQIVRKRWMGLMGTETQDVRSRVHPTQKPLEVCCFFIEKYSKPGGLVVDLFLGSGTTVISCERLGRRCFGCEIEPRHADVCLARYEAETGQTAQLLERKEDVHV